MGSALTDQVHEQLVDPAVAGDLRVERRGEQAALSDRDDPNPAVGEPGAGDDLHAVHGALTAQVLATTSAEMSVAERIEQWEEQDEVVVSRAVETLREICGDDKADLARMSVGLRVVRTLLASGV